METKKIMSTDVKTLGRHNTLYDASKMMMQYNIGSIVISNGNLIEGIITDRDIVMYYAKTKNIDALLEDAMSKHVLTVHEDSSIEDVTDMMGYGQVRRIIVVNSLGNMVGIVSLGDLANQKNCCDLSLEALTEISHNFDENPEVFTL